MKTVSYKKGLLKRLQDPDYASSYLDASLSESMEDGDFSIFLLALRNVVEAVGPVQQIAEESQLTRQHLYRMLNGNGNPTLATLIAVLKAVGLSIKIRQLE